MGDSSPFSSRRVMTVAFRSDKWAATMLVDLVGDVVILGFFAVTYVCGWGGGRGRRGSGGLWWTETVAGASSYRCGEDGDVMCGRRILLVKVYEGIAVGPELFWVSLNGSVVVCGMDGGLLLNCVLFVVE